MKAKEKEQMLNCPSGVMMMTTLTRTMRWMRAKKADLNPKEERRAKKMTETMMR